MMNREEIFSYLGLVHISSVEKNIKNVNLRQSGTMKLRRLNLHDDTLSDKISTCFATKRKLGGQTIARDDQENVKRSKSDGGLSTDESCSESDRREQEKMERRTKKKKEQRQNKEEKDRRTKLKKTKKTEARRGKATAKKVRRLKTDEEKAQQEVIKLKRKEERRLRKESKEKKMKYKADKLTQQADKFSNFFIRSNEVQIVNDGKVGNTLGQPQDQASDDDDDEDNCSITKYFEQDNGYNVGEDSDIEVVMAKVVKPIYPDAEKFCPLPFPTDKAFMTIAESCPRPRLTKKEKKYLDHVIHGMANVNEEDNRLKNVVQELRCKKPAKEMVSKSERIKIKHLQRGKTEILVHIPSFRGEWPAEKDKVQRLRRCPYRKLQEDCDEQDIWEDETDESDDDDLEKTKDRFSSSSEDSSWSDAEDFVLENVTQIPKIEQVAHGVSSDDDAVVADPERFKRKVIRTMNKFSAAQLVDAKYAWDKLETKIKSNLSPELRSLFEELLF